jgi:hypothetical protein
MLHMNGHSQWHPLVRSFLNAQREMLHFQHPCPDPRWTLRGNTNIDIPIQTIDTGHQLLSLPQDGDLLSLNHLEMRIQDRR